MEYVQLVRSQWPLVVPWFLIIGVALFVDFVLGTMAAFARKEVDSSVGKIGVFRKIGILMIVGLCIVMGPMLPVFDINVGGLNFKMPLAGAASFGFLVQECNSLIENAGKLGINVGFLAKYFRKLQPVDAGEGDDKP